MGLLIAYPGRKGVSRVFVVVSPRPLEVQRLEALDGRWPYVDMEAHGLDRLSLGGVDVACVRPNLQG